jgi:hypothetical protein
MVAPPGIGRPVPVPGSSGEPLPPAEGCTTEYESVGTDYCEVQQACTDDFAYTSCYADGTGAYSCSCSRNVGYNNHRLTGVDAASACTVAVGLCSGGVLPEYSEEAVCSEGLQSVGADYCDTQIPCGRVADLGDGVTAELATDYQSSSCWNQGDGLLSCSCSASGIYQSYVLSGIAVAESCGLVLDFCLSGETPEFSEPATCSLANSYQQTNGSNSYCQLEQICSQSSEVSPGVVASLTESDYVSCDTTSDASLCYCSSNTRNLRFELSSTEATACNDALAICASTAEIVPDGPLSCQRSFQNGSGAYCDTTFDCTQDAVVDGTTVGVYGSYSAFCQDAGDGSWSCSCSSGTEVAEITVSAADAWAACTDAGELCGDAVEVQIGSSSGGVIIVGGGVAVANPAPRPL